MSDIETFVVSRTGKRPLRFRGELIAVAERGTVTERAQSKFLASLTKSANFDLLVLMWC